MDFYGSVRLCDTCSTATFVDDPVDRSPGWYNVVWEAGNHSPTLAVRIDGAVPIGAAKVLDEEGISSESLCLDFCSQECMQRWNEREWLANPNLQRARELKEKEQRRVERREFILGMALKRPGSKSE